MLKDTNWKPANWTPPGTSQTFEEELSRVEADLIRDLLPYIGRLEALLPRLALIPGAQRAEMGAKLNLVAARVKGAMGRF